MPARPINTDDFGGEVYNLGMSKEARPLFDAVKPAYRGERRADRRGVLASAKAGPTRSASRPASWSC